MNLLIIILTLLVNHLNAMTDSARFSQYQNSEYTVGEVYVNRIGEYDDMLDEIEVHCWEDYSCEIRYSLPGIVKP